MHIQIISSSSWLKGELKMRKNELSLLYSYIYNQQSRYEQEIRQSQTNIRYRKIDIVDCFELMCCIERYNTFMQVSRDILQLLNIVEKSAENEKQER